MLQISVSASAVQTTSGSNVPHLHEVTQLQIITTAAKHFIRHLLDIRQLLAQKTNWHNIFWVQATNQHLLMDYFVDILTLNWLLNTLLMASKC